MNFDLLTILMYYLTNFCKLLSLTCYNKIVNTHVTDRKNKRFHEFLYSKDHLTNRLELRERPDCGVYVKDLSPFVCKGRTEIEHVMSVGKDF